jgi:chorismate synthase
MGVVIDGVPPGMEISADCFSDALKRRRSGSKGTTGRRETDIPEINAGVYKGKTSGAPLHIVFHNHDQNSAEYSGREFPRPGHADMAADQKYRGFNDPRGGGFFSGRMTVLLVAAGVVARKIVHNIQFQSEVISVGGQSSWQALLDEAIASGDSLGAEVKTRIEGLEPGVGEPFFNSIESEISRLIFSIPGAKAIAFGDGFAADKMKGSEFNDAIMDKSGKTASNHNGGITGGISNGMPVEFTVKFKPTSSIKKAQKSWHPASDQMKNVQVKGRHDVCYALRTPVVLESVAAIALVDLMMQKKGRAL